MTTLSSRLKKAVLFYFLPRFVLCVAISRKANSYFKLAGNFPCRRLYHPIYDPDRISIAEAREKKASTGLFFRMQLDSEYQITFK